jgi:hypothetical protein
VSNKHSAHFTGSLFGSVSFPGYPLGPDYAQAGGGSYRLGRKFISPNKAEWVVGVSNDGELQVTNL